MMRAILVKRNDPRSDDDRNELQMNELRELAGAAGYNIIAEMTQMRHPDRKYHLGRGKVEELSQIVTDLKPDKIIFHNPLSTMQIYNISETCRCETIDKFQLILEIFATRATTHRSKLQVELARLEYELPRARAVVSILKKDERPGFMGLGGYEDSYAQDIKNRMARIKNELETIQKDNESLRAHRHSRGFSLAALAGYTNAGKSTLFNALVDENVESKDMLFTTLLPTTRSLKVKGRDILVTDTVGFIEDLPHWMVDAFKSTLDEIFLADVVLLVVDSSEQMELIRKKLLVCHETMWDQLQEVAIVTVFNKIDLITDDELQEKMATLAYLAPHSVTVSAKTGFGFEKLKEQIQSLLPEWKRIKLSIPQSEEGMALVAWIYDEGLVHSINYTNTISIDFEARDKVINKAISLANGLS
ncbi:GTPase HflX [Methanolobus bombayensis]|uniref:GTPase HflX n=1 Tax=Methanolobus bombayensis TaxID=38023 RepID=UPI001AEA1492|nr:GTPase HflX [Methanolobus bombayensis]MBP1909924.1 GTP-binding protein HflX [Methanolobus bombayensis]